MNETSHFFLSIWREFLENPSFECLEKVLHEDVVFHSPVIWRPQRGKALCSMYLMAASEALKQNFVYTKKIADGNHLALEFSCKINDITVEGIDIITLNEEGKAIEFKVMVRPFRAIEAVKTKMLEMLNQMQ